MPDRIHPSLGDLAADTPFAARHIGPSAGEQAKMLAAVGFGSLDELTEAAVPAAIHDDTAIDVPPAASEQDVLAELRALAAANRPMVQMIGLGYADTATPPVIRRNVLEDPAWYTAYTPYQPEISQGRLEALLNFQTMVQQLTALPVAGASLLDEATAVAEAVTLMRRAVRGGPDRVVLDAECLPQTVAVVRTRAEALGIEVVVADLDSGGLPDGDWYGVVVQTPGTSGRLRSRAFYERIAAQAHERGALVAAAADLLALTLLTPPGEWGADLAVGSTQRFGVPLFYGGPHAAYMSVRKGLERMLPGRLVGVSVDADGQPAHRLALQTREQHIRRERATSNICTAQVLLAVVAAMYAVYHGPDGLRAIARRVHRSAAVLAAGLRDGGVDVVHDEFFDTVLAEVPGRSGAVVAAAAERGINLGQDGPDRVRVACDEVTTPAHLAAVWAAFGVQPTRPASDNQGDTGNGAGAARTVEAVDAAAPDALPADMGRDSAFLTHPVFHLHHSETAMLRYLRRLADADYALDRGMIPLGSCTMKLNATTEMEPVSWPELAGIHPFAPAAQVGGYLTLIGQLERWLAAATGYARVSLQPNAGSQGELAGLLAIRGYQRARGQHGRDVCLIPSSAHGTNAASAVMAGMRVVVVACGDDGEIDLDDLRAKIDTHRDQLAAIMVTYPSTHGVYEAGIAETCQLVHAAGGQVYIDGANLNALLGVARPGEFGGDVSHLNLHKTFCIPHGGGGPGVGPVAVREHLAPFLPGHPLHPQPADAAGDGTVGPVAAAPFGSAGILPISWAYVRLMGPDGLAAATKVAVLAANYVARRLAPHYPVLYTGRKGLVAHECIIDLRPLTKATGVTVDDVAKRLIDYGFHAPTMSFPVAGTLMVEPTESENLAELDRFCDAMIAIRSEIDRVGSGEWPGDDNPLKHAPHTAASVTRTDWPHPYTREQAAYPPGVSRTGKYWPPVRRIDQAYGDRNLVCACPPVESYS